MALPQNLVDARTTAGNLASTAGTTAAAEPLVSDVLRQKVMEAYSQNTDIVGPLDQKTQNYLQAPQVGREKYQGIFNPFTREKLVSQYIGTEALPMLALSNIYGNRMGRIQDTIGAGANAYKSQVMASQAKAENARQLYSDLLTEYVKGEDIRQADESSKLAREKFDWDKAHPSGNGDGDNPLEILTNIIAAEEKLGMDLNGDGIIGAPQQSFQEPPYKSNPYQSQQIEYPPKSGVFWTGDGQGGWR